MIVFSPVVSPFCILSFHSTELKSLLKFPNTSRSLAALGAFVHDISYSWSIFFLYLNVANIYCLFWSFYKTWLMQFLLTNNFKCHFVYKDSLISLKTALGLTVGLSPKAVPFNL